MPALQLTADDHLSRRIDAVDLKHRLCDVETDCRDRLHAWLPITATAPAAITQWHLRAGGGAVHSIKSRRAGDLVSYVAEVPTADSGTVGLPRGVSRRSLRQPCLAITFGEPVSRSYVAKRLSFEPMTDPEIGSSHQIESGLFMRLL